ncbi:uncharacterized protein EAE97_005706 [Botrytis byssoidea]|uniref:Fungal N-terminal domain-containing protein n=1 Tax=Botrytis byssoidea TaxID=139641 RepID=A0A9P5IJ99_9HELO|nr:uncharacterized protein EAE97_005706 [Botrytis byssoidea]KAF7943635.1 hypothetical protein EAE97_005706 [Botrytis byssoidea]
MDPVSIITLTGSVFTTGKFITSLITNLVTLKSKYKSASLMASHLIVQLTTIKAALDEMSNWIATSLQGADKNEQLIINLEGSLESCHVFLLMLEDHITRLDQNGIDRQLKGKVKLLWNESEIKELNNYLNRQINAVLEVYTKTLQMHQLSTGTIISGPNHINLSRYSIIFSYQVAVTVEKPPLQILLSFFISA